MTDARIITAPALDGLATLPDEIVHTCVTSPPFFGLRDYGVDGQLGLEPTPEAYVERLVGIFREVWRVLRDDGTLWLNLGDSYATGSGGDRNIAGDGRANPGKSLARSQVKSLKPKDLVGIPWRVAFALQADGWYLRSDIIWHKPNPMPESVTDRPTKAHEYIFLLTKEPRYFYDHEAVKEEAVKGSSGAGHRNYRPGTNGNQRKPEGQTEQDASAGRNRRSVWTVATQPFRGAHFAVFPPTLIEPCILAGSSERGCCSACGAPFERMVEKETRAGTGIYEAVTEAAVVGTKIAGTQMRGNPGKNLPALKSETTGWQPTCTCNADAVPCTVLDPFSGSGTTGVVSLAKGRHYVGIEINPEYAEMSRRRITDAAPLFNRVTVEAPR